MDFTQTLSDLGDWIAPYLTKDYLLNVWDIAKIILIIIAVIFIIKIVLKLKFFRRVKLILRNLEEINEKLNVLMDSAYDQEIGEEKIQDKKPNSLIKKFINKK